MKDAAGRPVLHVVGARPNFPKLAPVYAALASRGVTQQVVHTGQHFDEALSEVFFEQLGISEPDLNLGISAGGAAESIAQMMLALAPVFAEADPACVVVYGDVNSTLAAALTAQKLGIEVVHVEAGLRSRDRQMPEEINRLLTDQLSEVLLASSPDAVENLHHEAMTDRQIELVGNPMIDTLLANLDRFDVAAARARFALTGPYGVVTVHRPSNVDAAADARTVVRVVHEVADLIEVVFPVHPRGRAQLVAAGLADHPRVHLTEPLGYLEFMGLLRGAALVLTDSGGVQEETTIFGVPCLTLRENTERPVTITHGTNRLVRPDNAVEAAREALHNPAGAIDRPPLWDGRAGERIANVLVLRYGLGSASPRMAEAGNDEARGER